MFSGIPLPAWLNFSLQPHRLQRLRLGSRCGFHSSDKPPRAAAGMPEKHSKKPSPFFLMVLKTPAAKNGSHPSGAWDPRKSGRRTGGRLRRADGKGGIIIRELGRGLEAIIRWNYAKILYWIYLVKKYFYG